MTRPDAPYRNPDLLPEQRADLLLGEMTLREKASEAVIADA